MQHRQPSLSIPTFLLALVALLAGCWEGGTSPEALSLGLYECTGPDALRIKLLRAGEERSSSQELSSKVRVALNGISLGRLEQIEPEERLSEEKLLYTGPGPTVLWARGETVLLERFGKTRAHGCRALPDTARQEKPNQQEDLEKTRFRLNAWFRSPTGPGRYGYLLRYPRHLEIDQPRLGLVRFLYAGPKNDPPALTDGFTLHIGIERTSPSASLRERARDQIQNNRRAGGKLVSSFRDTTIRGHESLVWTEKTAMGPVASRLAVGLGPKTYVSVSYSAVGGKRKFYKQQVRRMLSTLRFTIRPAPPSRARVPLAMLSDLGGSSPNEGARDEASQDETSRNGAVKNESAQSGPSRNGPSQNGLSQNGSPQNCTSDGEHLERGCDEVVFAHRQVPLTADPLSAALDTLFSIDRDSVGGHRHFLSRTNETLSLRNVSREGAVVEVRLEGRLSGLRGICDHPRARIQIEETARRVAAVDSVALYLNGTPTDLQPGGRDP